jgi:DNA modification methylase
MSREKIGELELNTIYQVDCSEGMKIIPNDSVSLLLTDPPYNVSQKSNFHTMGRTGVDFGEWDKDFNQTLWLEIACDKVKKGGSAIIFNDYKNIGIMKETLENKGFVIKEMLVWKKSNPMPRNRDRLYVTSIEIAIWAVKGKGWAYNRQKETYENAIFEYPIVNHKKRVHPTQKPIELIEDIIKIHSNEGDVVLDCFMGSGTTAVACEKNNRRWLGFEVEDEYIEKANKRILELQAI